MHGLNKQADSQHEQKKKRRYHYEEDCFHDPGAAAGPDRVYGFRGGRERGLRAGGAGLDAPGYH